MKNYTKDNPAPWYDVRHKIEKVLFSDNITSIGDYAFYGFSDLSSISLPNTISHIGDAAFMECTSLSYIRIPDYVSSIPSDCFLNCTELSTVCIPKAVKDINEYAFFGCTELDEVVYYGKKQDWDSIIIEQYNNPLTEAPITFKSR